MLNILKQIHALTLKTNNTHCLKNNYQLIESLNKIKNVKTIVTYDFTDLFNNINLNDLYNIINDLFQKYFTKLKLTKCIDIIYFKTLKNFIICNNFIIHNSKIYLQVASYRTRWVFTKYVC